MIPAAIISARGEQRLTAGYPWIYRADVADVQTEGGQVVLVRGARGRPLGRALYSGASKIAPRMLAFGADHAPVEDVELIRRRLASAIASRESLSIDATAYRLVHGEGALLPSLTVDRHGEHVVLQALSQGMDRLLPAIVAALNDLLHPRGVLARNDPPRARPRGARAAGRRAVWGDSRRGCCYRVGRRV